MYAALSYCSLLGEPQALRKQRSSKHSGETGQATACARARWCEWLQGLSIIIVRCVRMLDFAHAAEYINDISTVQAAGGRLPARWLQQRCTGSRTRDQHGPPTRELLAARYPSPTMQEKVTYLQKREAHMQYPPIKQRLAHWLWQRRKRQQTGRRSTPQRCRHALRPAQRQSHASVTQRVCNREW